MLSERILERSSPLSHFLPATSSLFRIQGSNQWRNPMDTAVVEQLLDEMLAALEELETKATATLQYLKDKGHATDEDLAPYFEQAGNASNVRWRASRLRMMSLVSSALKGADLHKEKSQPSGQTAKKEKPEESLKIQAPAEPEQSAERSSDEGAHARSQAKASTQPGSDARKRSASEEGRVPQTEQSPPAEEKNTSSEQKATAAKPGGTQPAANAARSPTQEPQEPRDPKGDAA
jgi:hypothetical protein